MVGLQRTMKKTMKENSSFPGYTEKPANVIVMCLINGALDAVLRKEILGQETSQENVPRKKWTLYKSGRGSSRCLRLGLQSKI